MMLDLNVASSGESSSSVPENPLTEASGGGQMDDSGTSNSSVLNAEASSTAGDEDSCSTRPLGFQFGILKSPAPSVDEDDAEAEEVEEDASGFLTRQLFPPPPPVTAPPPVATVASSSSSRAPHWADLGFRQADFPSTANVPPPLPPPAAQPQPQVKKSRRGPRSRSSQYRGVTFYRRTGRWESHIWDCGKQVYLGGFDTAHAAARAYDRAAIKFRGVEADINFNLSDYDDDLKQMRNLSKEEFVHILRRQSTGFSRGSSKYRGVTLHKCGRWEARMGQFLGKKAYDKAAIKCNGREAVTNFEPSTYEGDMLPEADSEAIGHDLDLNLRISQPDVGSPKRSDNPMGLHFNFGSSESADAKKARIDNSSPILGGHPHSSTMAPEHPHIWNGLYPGYFPPVEERSTQKSPSMGMPSLPSWAWQMHDPTPLPLFSSAASSGFSTTTATAALAPPPPPAARHLQFPPPPTSTHYHSRS